VTEILCVIIALQCVCKTVPLTYLTAIRVIIRAIVIRFWNNNYNNVYFCNNINNFCLCHKLKTRTQYPFSPMYEYSL
jgi:hypothetical protein